MAEKAKKYFDVTVKVSWHATYKVEAEDNHEASDIIDKLLTTEQVDPLVDDPESYDREIEMGLGDIPEEGDTVYSSKDVEDS